MTTGRKSKLYYDAAGADNGTWTELKAVGDVNMPDSRNMEAINTRESPFQKNASGQRVLEITCNLKLKNGDAATEAIRDAYNNDTVIGIANYIGDMADIGAQGIQMDCLVAEFPKNLPLEGWANSDVKFVPAYDTTFEPVWAETTV